jgi:hypothetical protein
MSRERGGLGDSVKQSRTSVGGRFSQRSSPPRPQGCCKVLTHAPDLLKRARRSARSEDGQRSWRRQADHHIALTSEPSTARHAGGPLDRWLGWSDSACCLPSPQVRPRNADFAMALTEALHHSSPPHLPRRVAVPDITSLEWLIATRRTHVWWNGVQPLFGSVVNLSCLQVRPSSVTTTK